MSDAIDLADLPLFPLGTVLFPGGLLPLRIFEVRYLDMISTCHKAGTPFGVVSLTQGKEVRQRSETPSGDAFANEAFQAVGTLCKITEYAKPQSGLMTIRCIGTQRFRIRSNEKLKHGLWMAQASRLPDDMPVALPADLQAAADALDSLIRTLQDKDVPDDQMPLAQPYQLADCGWVANRWSELLPISTALKQQLMELDNPLVRLELVNDILDRSGLTLG